LEGYPGTVHGGVVATLLDSAMTQCLFARNCKAHTARLEIRYRHPVMIGERSLLRAWVERSHSRLHLLRAELRQRDRVAAEAHATFIEAETPRQSHDAHHDPR
jgi:acyl-coenzyme A thioesterase PaaI-like protein